MNADFFISWDTLVYREVKVLAVRDFCCVFICASLILGSSCRKHVTYKENGLSGPVKGTEANTKPVLEDKKKTPSEPTKTKAASLKVYIKSLKEFKLGGQTGVSIFIERDKEPDYYRYFICNDKSLSCNPEPQAPGEFVLSGHQHSTPPGGRVTVHVSACIRSDRSLNRQGICGPFSRAHITLRPSEDPKLTKELEELAHLRRAGKKDCQDFFDRVGFYYDRIKGDKKLSESQLMRSVRQQMELGKDLSCELVYSTAFDELVKEAESGKAAEEPAPSEKRRKWGPESVALVSLGSFSTLTGAGIIAQTYGFDIRRLIPGFRLTIGRSSATDHSHMKNLIHSVNQNKGAFSELAASISDFDKSRDVKGLLDLYQHYTHSLKKSQDFIAARVDKIKEYLRPDGP